MRRAWAIGAILATLLLIGAPVTVAALEYSAAYTVTWPQSYPPGGTVMVNVTVKNTGELAWNRLPDAQGKYFVLGYHWQGPVTTHSTVPETGLLPIDVPPNGTATVAVPVSVPATSGSYTLQFDMVHLGSSWFTGCCGVVGAGAPNPGAGKVVTVGTATLGGLDPSVLCEFVECGTVTISAKLAGHFKGHCITPKVNGIVPILTVVTQGGGATLTGCGFGGAPGQIVMKGLSSGDVPLTDLQWSWTGVAGLIPSSLVVTDPTPVTFEVITKGGLKASSPSVTFNPKMEWKRLPRSAVKVTSCSFAADANICNNVLQTDGDFIGPPGGTEAIRGHHHNNWGSFSDSNQDKYAVTLKNNHKFVSVQTSKWGADSGEYSATLPTVGDVQGKPSLSLTVPWSIGGDDRVTYSIDLWVEGPVNVTGW